MGFFAQLWGIVTMFISTVLRVAFWGLVAIAGLAGVLASANSLRFRQRVAGEADRTLTASAARRIDRGHLEKLPAPVRRYLAKAIGPRSDTPRNARLQQTGTFRPDLKGKWYPIRAEQYFTDDPPGFIWWGRVRIAPGIWIDARDRSVGGIGNMLVMAESTFPLANSSGPELNQGALLRLLGELVLVPTAYLDHRYVRWSPVDNRQSVATFTVGGLTVTGTFEFGDDDLPARFTAERFRDVGGGKSVLTPFVGEYTDYRVVDGMAIPHEMAGSWVIDGSSELYARFSVARIEFGAIAPY